MSDNPPPYSVDPPPYVPQRSIPASSSKLNPLTCLQGYDIIYIVDDSASMSWKEKHSGIVPWIQTQMALKTFATMCEEWDSNGQDLWFLNQHRPFLNLSPRGIAAAFDSVKPRGGTNMAATLIQVMSGYFATYTPHSKPLNILAITDGCFSDDVIGAIRWINTELDRLHCPENQVGIQFVQVGSNRDAGKFLKSLDDDLRQIGFRRDIVDTVPWNLLLGNFNELFLVKAVCGAIDKRWDKQDTKNTKRGRKKRGFLFSSVTF